MSKQGELLDVAALTDWAKVYRTASETDRKIVDWVRAHPGSFLRDIVQGTGIPDKTLSFRLWELSGRSTGPHRADGLLIATKWFPRERADLPQGLWRYHAREW